MRTAASVYRWQQQFFVHPRYVRGGYSVVAEPVVSLPEAASSTDLGRALRQSLDLSARIRREPGDEMRARVLRALGAKSWLALERGARCVSVDAEGGEVRMTPLAYSEDKTERERGRRGEEKFPVPATCTDETLGAMMRRLTQ